MLPASFDDIALTLAITAAVCAAWALAYCMGRRADRRWLRERKAEDDRRHARKTVAVRASEGIPAGSAVYFDPSRPGHVKSYRSESEVC